ncbi:hypothetical protein P8C59_004189 [Phyllachora maydis]|uniref:Uncharacterized protein n=1 Tax=Phyllachora maydis TaxID=1825666 RepID=A0AAD9ME50_9PEZI|nr:hypothetical protein P8C59_004189 [Phyllachora maydis]
MRSVFGLVAAAAALAGAQVIVHDNGTYTCPIPNAAYCAGDSLKTDIIIRCDSKGNGQPGRCSDNLAGEPPYGDLPADCWQTSVTSGDAACEKNCVVYGASGNANGTFTLPADQCTPSVTASPSAPTPCSSSASAATTALTTATTNPQGGINGTRTASATTAAVTVQTAAAEAKRAMGAFAGLGMFAAYLL